MHNLPFKCGLSLTDSTNTLITESDCWAAHVVSTQQQWGELQQLIPRDSWCPGGSLVKDEGQELLHALWSHQQLWPSAPVGYYFRHLGTSQKSQEIENGTGLLVLLIPYMTLKPFIFYDFHRPMALFHFESPFLLFSPQIVKTIISTQNGPFVFGTCIHKKIK